MTPRHTPMFPLLTLAIALAMGFFALAASPLGAAPATQPARVVGDEVDAMLNAVPVPARFADHRPRWHVEEFERTFQELQGRGDVEVLGDHGRRSRGGLHPPAKGSTRASSSSPTSAQARGRRSRSFRKCSPPSDGTSRPPSAANSALMRGSPPPPTPTRSDAKTSRSTVIGSSSPGTYQGTTDYQKWTHRDKQPQAVDVTNTATLGVDPQLGYVVTVEERCAGRASAQAVRVGLGGDQRAARLLAR